MSEMICSSQENISDVWSQISTTEEDERQPLLPKKNHRKIEKINTANIATTKTQPTWKKVVKVALLVFSVTAIIGSIVAISLSTFGAGIIPASYGIAGFVRLGVAALITIAIATIKKIRARRKAREEANKQPEAGLTFTSPVSVEISPKAKQ